MKAKAPTKTKVPPRKPKGVSAPEIEKKGRGRPTTVDFELCSKIFDRMTIDGDSLRAICRDEDFPAIGTFLRWVSAHTQLREQYDMAMQLRAEKHVEEIVEIADDAVNDWMETHGKDDIGYKINGEHVQRSRLRIDARKWAASKLLPRYADKVDLNHGVQPDNPLGKLLDQISGTPLRPEAK